MGMVIVDMLEMICEQSAPPAGKHDVGCVGQRAGEAVGHAADTVDEAPHDAALERSLRATPHRLVGQSEWHAGKLRRSRFKRPPDEGGAGRDRPPTVDTVSMYDLARDGGTCIHDEYAARGSRCLSKQFPSGHRSRQPIGPQRVRGLIGQFEGEGHSGTNGCYSRTRPFRESRRHGLRPLWHDGRHPNPIDRALGKVLHEYVSPGLSDGLIVPAVRTDRHGEHPDECITVEDTSLHGTVSNVEREEHTHASVRECVRFRSVVLVQNNGSRPVSLGPTGIAARSTSCDVACMYRFHSRVGIETERPRLGDSPNHTGNRPSVLRHTEGR